LKILILKPSSLGDVIQALPVLRLLKLHLPHSEIYWWLDGGLRPLLEGDRDLAGIVSFHRKRWARPQHWGEVFASVRNLRAHQFDWVIDLQCLARSGAFAWLANGGLLVGLDEVREGARGFYDRVASRNGWQTHAVDWYLGVLPLLGVPVHHQFEWLPVNSEAAWKVSCQRISPQPLVLFCPGARWENKRWPAAHFATLAQRLAKARPELQFGVVGGAQDEELGRQILAAVPGRGVNLCGRTTLPEMIEWLRGAAVLITNDTGPMHAAAALGTPVVALFGPTEPTRTGPYGQLDRVFRQPLPCVPCMKGHCSQVRNLECLLSLAPDLVGAAVLQLLP
jgi:lipopolysaccharide heptosyltransferase I